MFEAEPQLCMPGAFTTTPYETQALRERQSNYLGAPSSGASQQASINTNYTDNTQQAQNTDTNMAYRLHERAIVVNKKRSRTDTITMSTFSHSTPQQERADSFFDPTLIPASPPQNTMMRNPSYNGAVPHSPLPFVNTRYQIAGGLDTPTQQVANYFEDSEFSDTNYRRNLANATSRRRPADSAGESGYHSFARLPSTASMENNGQPRVQSPTQVAPSTPSGGWGKLALNVVGGVSGVVGGVVGKVWQFCKSGTFTGFGAGGGQRYQLDPHHTKGAEVERLANQINFVPIRPDAGMRTFSGMPGVVGQAVGDVVPGQYPDVDGPPPPYEEKKDDSVFTMVNYPDAYPSPAPPPQSPPRPAKRRQISFSNENDKSWVVVPIPSSPAPAPMNNPIIRPRLANRSSYSSAISSSNARRQPLASGYGSLARAAAARGVGRPVLGNRSSGVSTTPTPGFITPPPVAPRPSTASFASPRSSFGAATPSRIPIPATPGSGRSTPTGTRETPSRIPLPASTFSGGCNTPLGGRPGTPGGRSSTAGRGGSIGDENVPMSPAALAATKQAKQWAHEKRKEDMEVDVGMMRINAQMQAMIREAKEALGTRFEVREADEDMEDY